MMMIMIDSHRMVMMVTYVTVVNAWWIPVFDMLVHFIMWYCCLLVNIFSSISTSVMMIRRVDMIWVTNVTIRVAWIAMVYIMVMYWPMMVMEMCLGYLMMMVVVDKYMVRSMMLMMNYCNTVRFTIRRTVWVTSTTVPWTISMTSYITMVMYHVTMTIHMTNMTMCRDPEVVNMNGIFFMVFGTLWNI